MDIQQAIGIDALILSGQSILYFGCGYFQKNSHNVERPIDKKIPLIPGFLLIYILWFPLIALFPLHLSQVDPVFYRTYLYAWVLDILISIGIYMIYPSTFIRPKEVESLPLGWALAKIYKYSYKGLNCMPSMHCSLSALVGISAILSFPMGGVFPFVYGLVALGIIVSTLFTKQHVFIDMVTGILLAILCLAIASFL